jgi:glycosyltransferase involved in cell wall biosynthesis
MTLRLEVNASGGRRPILFRWAVSSFTGWGIVGLNFALHLAADRRFAPIGAEPWGPVVLDPIRTDRLASVREASRAFCDAVRNATDDVTVNAPLLHTLDADLDTGADRPISGSVDIGIVVMTDTNITPAGRQRGQRYPALLTACTWNAEVVRGAGLDHVTTVLQGVDLSLFHPAPPSGLMAGHFVVFSGGKLEFRKGQDLVMAAFRHFHARHPEALLLTAWHSPWPELGKEFPIPPPARPDGMVDVTGWAVAHGLPPSAVMDVGAVPNIAMPHVLREADVALFANRAEGGTNLVAMETMACGVPTILSANTGHLDLLPGDGAWALRRQRPVVREGIGTAGWGESDVEEMLEALETLWRDRAQAKALGARGAAAMTRLSWQNHIAALTSTLGPLLT